jgi:uncharacterized membrane protein HdeD (DUF308 family)
MGVLTAAIGVAMIVYPLATAALSTVFVGAALLIAALAQFVFAFTSPTAGNFFLKLLLGVVYGIAGVALAFFPLAGVMTLTVVLGAMLVAEALLETILAFVVPASMGRGWLLLSALASLALGLLILFQWPTSSGWAIGTLVGVAVLVNGITRAALSSTVRKELRSAQPLLAAA